MWPFERRKAEPELRRVTQPVGNAGHLGEIGEIGEIGAIGSHTYTVGAINPAPDLSEQPPADPDPDILRTGGE